MRHYEHGGFIFTRNRRWRNVWFVHLPIFVVAYIAGMWKTLDKANEPGWAAIIPIYNIYKLLKIGGNSGWWVIGIFIPLVNVFVVYTVARGVAKAFGQGLGFTLGLWFLGFIFFPILGFGDYRYQGTS